MSHLGLVNRIVNTELFNETDGRISTFQEAYDYIEFLRYERQVIKSCIDIYNISKDEELTVKKFLEYYTDYIEYVNMQYLSNINCKDYEDVRSIYRARLEDRSFLIQLKLNMENDKGIELNLINAYINSNGMLDKVTKLYTKGIQVFKELL